MDAVSFQVPLLVMLPLEPERRLERPESAPVTLEENVWLGARVVGAQVLDLFAGTGGLGLEAASRGAAAVTFVESAPAALQCLRANLELFRARYGGSVELSVVAAEARSQLRQFGGNRVFGLIFADPPYDLPQLPDLPELVLNGELLVTGGLFILEHPKKINFKGSPCFEQHRNYGEVNFSFFRKSAIIT